MYIRFPGVTNFKCFLHKQVLIPVIPMTGIFFALTIGFRHAKVVNIELEGLRQLTIGVIIPSVDNDAVLIVVRPADF